MKTSTLSILITICLCALPVFADEYVGTEEELSESVDDTPVAEGELVPVEDVPISGARIACQTDFGISERSYSPLEISCMKRAFSSLEYSIHLWPGIFEVQSPMSDVATRKEFEQMAETEQYQNKQKAMTAALRRATRICLPREVKTKVGCSSVHNMD